MVETLIYILFCFLSFFLIMMREKHLPTRETSIISYLAKFLFIASGPIPYAVAMILTFAAVFAYVLLLGFIFLLLTLNIIK